VLFFIPEKSRLIFLPPANCGIKNFKFLIGLAVLAAALKIPTRACAAQSQWVYLNSSNRLEYKTLPQGDRIMDFSYAGYGSGGVPIPGVPAVITVSPSNGDDTTNIQNALDKVSQMPLTNGFRGAVLLSKGIFYCSGPLIIRASGVVLRGYGTGMPGTMIRMTTAPHLCVSIEGIPPDESNDHIAITDKYVPSGAMSFHVADGSSFKPGDSIFIYRPATSTWVAFMGMNDLVRNGKQEHWVGRDTITRRTVAAVSGNTITLDAPLTDSFDSQYLNPPGAWVVHASTSGWIHNVGVENFQIMSPPQAIPISQKSYRAINIDDASDVWVRSLVVNDTIGSIHTGPNTSRITIEDVAMKHTVATVGAALPADFSVDGTQTLLVRCTDIGNHLFYFVTLTGATGPNVLFNCDFRGNGSVSPHERWATGLLFDNCHVNNGGIDLMNRGEMGSGHGWTSGWSVAWNCVAKNYIIQQPPGTENWAIGCAGTQDLAPMPFGKGPMLPQGMIESSDQPVEPASLYLEQLSERLGDKMVMP
jgi:hypothetical protein